MSAQCSYRSESNAFAKHTTPPTKSDLRAASRSQTTRILPPIQSASRLECESIQTTQSRETLDSVPTSAMPLTSEGISGAAGAGDVSGVVDRFRRWRAGPSRLFLFTLYRAASSLHGRWGRGEREAGRCSQSAEVSNGGTQWVLGNNTWGSRPNVQCGLSEPGSRDQLKRSLRQFSPPVLH